MNKIKITYNNKDYELTHPERMNELTAEQYSQVVSLAYNSEYGKAEQLQLLYFLLDINSKNIDKYKILDEAVRYLLVDDLLKLQEFVFELDNADFNRWLIPELNIGKKKLYGPNDRFGYMQFGQFIVADMLAMSYFTSNQEATLHKLIAALFLDNKENQFETKQMELHLELIASLPAAAKKAVLINYTSVRRWLESKYSHVFPKNVSQKQPKQINLGKKQNSWLTIRRNMAGSVLNMEKVDKLLLSDVLYELNEQLQK